MDRLDERLLREAINGGSLPCYIGPKSPWGCSGGGDRSRISEYSVSESDIPRPKRKSGIPTGNAGEYLVMGELLRRGFDAQLADRNTKGYDLLAGPHNADLKRVQVKSVRTQPWFVSRSSFAGAQQDQITVYVLLGNEKGDKPVRFFIAKNHELAEHVHYPDGWAKQGFMSFKAVQGFENRWDSLRG
jgi:hypothetical protein